MIEKIGTFKTKSDVLRITDPCYTKDTWCSGILKDCKIGEWSAFFIYSDEGSWGTRVSQILVIFGNVTISEAQKILDESNWENSEIHVGVDSGQAGIFEDVKYPEDETGEYGDTNTFYGKCCELTCENNEQGGVLDFGVVSSSGYGDGSYDCLLAKKDDKINAIKIIFIDENNLSNENEEEEELD